MKRISTSLFICLWLFCCVQFGVSDSEPKPSHQPPISNLSLQEAIDSALKHSPLIKQAEITVALAELDLKATHWWRQWIPNLNLHHGYDPIVGDNRIGFTMNFDLDRLLGQGSAPSKKAQLKLFDRNVYLETVKRQVITAVTRSYFAYLIAKKKVRLIEGQLSRDVKRREILGIQFESGQIQLAPLLQIETVISNDHLGLLEAQANVKLAELQLKSDIGHFSSSLGSH